ncbi:MAG: HPr family phosphocarrier protein [Phycisphaerales bacterium]|nr:HPr family phosphocarrier protein [Phycisphaerales bacterium]
MSNATAKVIIRNRLGLHARPAMSFVETASNFKSDVCVRRDAQKVDGKSIMQMMMLAATKGTELTIEVSGQDCREALKALIELVERGFDEE